MTFKATPSSTSCSGFEWTKQPSTPPPSSAGLRLAQQQNLNQNSLCMRLRIMRSSSSQPRRGFWRICSLGLHLISTLDLISVDGPTLTLIRFRAGHLTSLRKAAQELLDGPVSTRFGLGSSNIVAKFHKSYCQHNAICALRIPNWGDKRDHARVKWLSMHFVRPRGTCGLETNHNIHAYK